MTESKNEHLPENKMGVMPVGRLLAGMSVPMMISMLVQAFYNVVDSIFVAQLSEDALTAVSLAFPLQNLIIAFGGGLAVGMNAALSRSLGEKRFEVANRCAHTGIFLSICCGIAFALIGIFLVKPFFNVMTNDAEILSYGIDYSTICLIGGIAILMQFCFERLLQSTGRTFPTMITQMIGAIINIILDPILIFGWGPIPALGVSGAAYATITGQVVAAIIAIIVNIKCNHDIKLSFREIRFDAETAGQICRIGFPSTLMQSVGSVMNFGLNHILLTFSTTATAVFGAYFKLQSFIFMPIFGLNNGMVPIISYNYGARRMDRVKKTITLTIITAVSIMAVGVIAFEAIPELLLSFFNADAHMTAIGVPALRIIAPHFLLAGFCIIAGSVCQAIGNPKYSLIVSACRQLVVLLPAAWLLAQTGVLDYVWLSFPIAEIASLILSAIFLKKTLNAAKNRQ